MSTRMRLGFHTNNCFFITTTFQMHKHLFVDERFYRQAAESLNFCCEKYDAEILAFVFMPSHIHLIVFFNSDPRCSDFMRDFKKYTSVMFRRMIGSGEDTSFFESLSYQKGRQRYKVWSSRFHAIAIRHRTVLLTKIRYIHDNPVKAGLAQLAEDYNWSSARWYIDPELKTVVRIRHAASVI